MRKSPSIHLFSMGILAASTVPQVSEAQINDFGARQRSDLAEPPVKDRPPETTDDHQHLLRGWQGRRKWLMRHGIDIIPAYMLEAAGNVSGGVSQGSAYTGRFGIDLEIDWGQLGHIRGLKSHILVVSNSGRDLSTDRLDNDPYSAMELYGRLGTFVKLQFAYLTQDLAHDHVQFAAGRANQSLFFNSSPIYCMFLSLAICRVPRSLTNANPNGFYSGGRANWGGYIRYRPAAQFYAQIGAFEASPSHGGASGFNWSMRQTNGVNLPFELGWQSGGDARKRPSHIALGGYYDNAPISDVFWDRKGGARALTGLSARQSHHHTAIWVLVDYMIERHTSSSVGGLIVFGNFTRTDPNISTFKQQVTFGFENIGEISTRPKDGFGVQVTHGWVSNAMRLSQNLHYAHDGRYPNGLFSAQSYEIIIEAQYSYHLYHAVDLQPDFQYIVHPNAQAGIRNAAILGGRARVNF